MKNFYNCFTDAVANITKKYPFIIKDTIGTSVEGREIPILKIGTGKKEVLFVGAHHGMEWITSHILLKFLSDYAKAINKNTNLRCHDMQEVYNTTVLSIIPMLNPDGVIRATSSLESFKCWQANSNGVDLNHNYNARWADCKKMEQLYGITCPGPTRYGGEYPESEPESRALAEYVRKSNIQRAYAFHSQGEVIYWSFDNCEPPESKSIAKKLAQASGYQLDEPEEIASSGGFKDWFINEYHRPGFTIEVGSGTNPLPFSDADKIYSQIADMLYFACVL